MNELERIARLLCEADGRNPDDPAWSAYAEFAKATLDAVATGRHGLTLADLPAMPLTDWAYTCTISPKHE